MLAVISGLRPDSLNLPFLSFFSTLYTIEYFLLFFINIKHPVCFLCFRHNDLPWNIRKFVHNQLGKFNFSDDLRMVEPWSKSNWSHTDLPRLRAGLVGAQVSRLDFLVSLTSIQFKAYQHSEGIAFQELFFSRVRPVLRIVLQTKLSII